MAAPGQVSGVSQRLERGLSTESCITARTPGPVVSPVSLDLRVSPGQVAELPGKNLWEQICEEYEAELPPFPEGYKAKQEAVVTASPSDERVLYGFNTEHLYPAAPLAVVPQVSCPQVKRETIDPETCSPKEYLETFIFPVLLPGMASLLHQAKKEKCFELVSRLHREVQAALSHLSGASVLALGSSAPLCLALVLQLTRPAPSQPAVFRAAFQKAEGRSVGPELWNSSITSIALHCSKQLTRPATQQSNSTVSKKWTPCRRSSRVTLLRGMDPGGMIN
ncbi:IQ domain-containing protein K isoform X3 [Delphinus delphis]|uniref:IQ domain-containing protein K isoform X3 n=1 Tax=Delphinus delphis TaxID=9728 RepID=UPI0028C38D1C|nr:IQ domain-containing protein K isoform X3 [Delphinus delphis]